MCNPRPQWNRNEYVWATCSRSGKRHEGRCLPGRDGSYACGESGLIMKVFLS